MTHITTAALMMSAMIKRCPPSHFAAHYRVNPEFNRQVWKVWLLCVCNAMLFIRWQSGCQASHSDTMRRHTVKNSSQTLPALKIKRADVWQRDLCANIKVCVCVCVLTWVWGHHVVNKRHIISTPITTVSPSVLFLFELELLLRTGNCYELWQIVKLKVRQRGCGLLAVK